MQTANKTDFQSWGRYPRAKKQNITSIYWRDQACLNQFHSNAKLLPVGLGRSYGDSCLNSEGTLLSTTGLNRFIHLDTSSDTLTCEAGLSFAEILRLLVPRGYFLPVTPGTKFVTVGGAVANDIHGKNHHQQGSFGNHVLKLELVRSDGQRLVCSEAENSQLFFATIGGLGLTGLITWVQFKLLRINSPFIDQEIIKFQNVRDFFSISEDSNQDFQYTVAWIDTSTRGKNLGRGHFIRGNHSQKLTAKTPKSKLHPNVLLDCPNWSLNAYTVKAFNSLYFNRVLGKIKKNSTHYDPFFYPLDSIANWNRIYGKRGFVQYQFVVPFDCTNAISEVLDRVAASKMASFLSVLKTFGEKPSLGLLSFPRPGITLTLDFPVSGEKLLSLLKDLDSIVTSANGALYPAKDARMPAEMFQLSFPHLNEFKKFIDPLFSSSFWRRVNT